MLPVRMVYQLLHEVNTRAHARAYARTHARTNTHAQKKHKHKRAFPHSYMMHMYLLYPGRPSRQLSPAAMWCGGTELSKALARQGHAPPLIPIVSTLPWFW